jgi:hypothetical protein
LIERRCFSAGSRKINEEKAMADNKKKTDGRDRAKVSASEPYEVSYFAKKHGLAAEQAREIIEKHGPSREACDAAAERKR